MDRRGFLTGVGVVGLGALVGCSNDDPDPSPSTAATSASPSTSGPTPAQSVDPVVADTIADGINVPWGIAFLKTGEALVSQRDAREVVRVAPDGKKTTIGAVEGGNPSQAGEGGLLGIALDPKDPTQLYAYISTASDNRILRLAYDGRRLSDPKTILTGIPVGQNHNGGRLVFGPDDALYVSTGEAGDPDLAQDKKSLGGKVLRITRDGKASNGNPFDSPVWSYGHRNVEGLTFDAEGRLWAAEFGDKTTDELNLVRRGRNYGWPEVEGPSDDDAFTDPSATWTTDECSPASVAVTRSHAFLGALKGESLWVVPLDGSRAGEPKRFLQGEYWRLRTVAVAPSGDLWLTTSNTDGRSTPGRDDDRILRVTL
ncbi:glucose sorbosone dehydrogenase [Aeromicrobium sp. Root495]|uniref:PQQ-dependent sugar dehydrogenase n=1 Tax=Aeromicrobium sp. Root495 TaxID=1736550 RepID=UPI0006FAB4BC|nr:PQQ-dependent sugar dehydrogenase [Aeromicrobium sp. Root495]KQY59465.1 glucose sorbosone dehydrogenase [Aeromicrobium sp. Root495]